MAAEFGRFANSEAWASQRVRADFTKSHQGAPAPSRPRRADQLRHRAVWLKAVRCIRGTWQRNVPSIATSLSLRSFPIVTSQTPLDSHTEGAPVSLLTEAGYCFLRCN